jgi:signal peptidase I
MNMATQITDPKPLPVGPDYAPAKAGANKPHVPLLRQLAQFLVVSALAFASYFLISHYVLQSVKVVGRSMVPTLYDSQQYLLNRWIYHFHAPRPGDIVVLRDPSDNGFSVKRVIGKPGDSIYLKDGWVYLNGWKLSEPYLLPGTQTFTDWKYRDQLIHCGQDQYFVLGDNRPNSIDSRTYGPVPRRNILGPLMQ